MKHLIYFLIISLENFLTLLQKIVSKVRIWFREKYINPISRIDFKQVEGDLIDLLLNHRFITRKILTQNLGYSDSNSRSMIEKLRDCGIVSEGINNKGCEVLILDEDDFWKKWNCREKRVILVSQINSEGLRVEKPLYLEN